MRTLWVSLIFTMAVPAFAQSSPSIAGQVNSVGYNAPVAGTKFMLSIGNADISTRQVAKVLDDYLRQDLGFVEVTTTPDIWVLLSTSLTDQGSIQRAPTEEQKKRTAVANALGALGAGLSAVGGQSGQFTPYQAQGDVVHVWGKALEVTFVKYGTTQEQYNAGQGIVWEGTVQASSLDDNLLSSVPTLLNWLFKGYPVDQTAITHQL